MLNALQNNSTKIRSWPYLNRLSNCFWPEIGISPWRANCFVACLQTYSLSTLLFFHWFAATAAAVVVVVTIELIQPQLNGTALTWYTDFAVCKLFHVWIRFIFAISLVSLCSFFIYLFRKRLFRFQFESQH